MPNQSVHGGIKARRLTIVTRMIEHIGMLDGDPDAGSWRAGEWLLARKQSNRVRRREEAGH